jgi:Fic family protein
MEIVMYLTEVLGGRPYQCFIPQPLLPSVEQSRIKAFTKLDRALKIAPDKSEFFHFAAATVAQPRNKMAPAGRHSEAHAVLSAWLERERLGIEPLKKINAALTGKKEAVFRARPVWMGSAHPSDSWHVGSPPGRLNGLMKNLMDIPQSNLPASMQALIGLLRVLQIHPFEDGNGRTARFYAIWLAHRKLGLVTGMLSLLDALCDRPQFDLNAASLEVQNSGRFETFFDQALDLYQTNN